MSPDATQLLQDSGVSIMETLRSIEDQILETLVISKGQPVSKHALEDVVYSADSGRIRPASNCIQVYMARLRRKLSHSSAIETVHGKGYRFLPPKEKV
jgi:DNA-binding response OmpR family regulator